ncbi:MAG: outer membrane beta-barrel protein [Deltaproteobacteria bacterium]|nr:outer membrane beta-barrel protein [Deltaproteobacteria bacterium]
MRKFLILAVALAFVGGAAVAQADEYVKGQFELSGHVNTGASFQHNGANGASASVIGSTAVVAGVNAANSGPLANHGPQGDLTIQNTAGPAGTTAAGVSSESLLFFVDEFELDAMRSFGENIRARADMSMGRLNSGTGFAAGFNLEQAYATANIPVGNGVEFLIGRFDTPIGFESVERGENTLFSHSLIFNGLRPHQTTGIKVYYPFSDMVDWHLYIVNNLRDEFATATDHLYPSFGTRVGFNWGEEGKRSTLGISAAGGPEVIGTAATGKMGDWTFMGDVDWNVWLTDAFAVGGEGIFRQDSAAAGATDSKYFAGQLNLNYVFNDVWDGTLRYVYAQQNAGAGTLSTQLVDSTAPGAKSKVHEVTLGGQYQIADGAKIQLEYRFDIIKPSAAARGTAHGGLVNFTYDF